MEIFATIVMLSWIPAVLILFAVLPPPRAVIVAFLCAWLFLPVVSYKLPVLPDYTKMSATCAGVFLGALLFDAKRLLRFVPSWFDLPILILCVCPFFSSMSNGLGEWDGLSSAMVYTVAWGMPYFIGRIYFTDIKLIRELAVGIVVGGLLYVPLCLFEIRMSPKLHEMVYGFAARGVQMRFGGWRPNVFMDGGLQVGLWMTGASLVGLWLAWIGVWKKLWGVSANTLALVLLVTTLLCRSSESLVLLFAGLGALGFFFYTKSRMAFVVLLLMPPVYIVARSTEAWHAEQVVELARMVDAERAGSLKFRIDNEDILIARAVQQPVFGWGGWGRSRVHDEWGKDISITDGHWIIELGAHGIIGVTSCFAALLLPLGLLTTQYPVRRLLSNEMAPVLVLSMIVTLYAIDCLPNALPNPVYMLADGAVVGFVCARRNQRIPAAQNELQGDIDGPAESIPLRRLHPGSV
jgi:hypothetical protein